MTDNLDALQRIVAYLRLAREELAADLDRMDRRDLGGGGEMIQPKISERLAKMEGKAC